MNRVKKMVMQEPVQKVIETFNGDSTLVTYTSQVIEKGDPEFGARSWQQGVLSNLTQKANGYTFEYISDLIPPRVKSLEEARGFVISDYQTYLEQKWVRSLGEKYRVKVVDHEFDKLIETYQK
jgi:peptidyl-prolyl cis-trans isomerase SurA